LPVFATALSQMSFTARGGQIMGLARTAFPWD
jgi:hypothetical protein